jgi:hypothetical protein
MIRYDGIISRCVGLCPSLAAPCIPRATLISRSKIVQVCRKDVMSAQKGRGIKINVPRKAGVHRPPGHERGSAERRQYGDPGPTLSLGVDISSLVTTNITNRSWSILVDVWAIRTAQSLASNQPSRPDNLAYILLWTPCPFLLGTILQNESNYFGTHISMEESTVGYRRLMGLFSSPVMAFWWTL